jgi:SPOR domain
MARSNGIPDRTTGQPARAVRGAAQPVDHGLPWNPASPNAQPGAYPADPQFAPHGYDQQPTGRPTPSPAQLPWPQAGQPVAQQPHAQPNYAAAPPQTYAPQQPSYPTQPAYPPASYATDPHHGHYFPPAQAEQPQAYAAQAYPEAAAQLRGSYPGHGEPAYPPAGQTAAYQAQPQYAPQQPQTQPAHDPRGYEFGAYATNPPPYTDPATGRGHTQPAPQAGYANAYAPQHPGQPQFNPGPAQPTAQHADAHQDAEFDDEEFDDEEEEAPRRFGLLKVIASLVVAIGIGAGGAYGYKKFANPTVAGVKPMAVRADAPTKKGEQLNASADLKAGERLNDVPAVVPSGDANADGTSPAGARRVQTIPIVPQGIPGMAVQQPPMRPTISVPGMAIDGMVASSPPAAALPPVVPAPAGRAIAPPPVQAQPQRAPVAPRVIAALEEPAAAPAPSRPAPKVAVPKVAKGNDAYLPGGAPSQVGAAPATASAAVAPAKAATNGYVAVLDSRGSAIDARKALDDLQGRFGEVLGGKPTDVTEFANPKDGKTYYRAVVGPPGSREAAVNVCSQIKAAGHKDCFAAAY